MESIRLIQILETKRARTSRPSSARAPRGRPSRRTPRRPTRRGSTAQARVEPSRVSGETAPAASPRASPAVRVLFRTPPTGCAPPALDAPRAPEVEHRADLRAETLQRAQRVEVRGITADADVRLFAVVHDPREIARREARVEETVKDGRAFERHVAEDVFDADYPLAILVEPEVARDARARPVSADDVARAHSTRAPRALKRHERAPPAARVFAPRVARLRRPLRARAQTLFEVVLVEPSHAPDAKLVVRAFEHERAPRGRVELDVPDGRAEAVLGQIEVFESPPDEDARGVHRVGERALAVYEQNAHAPPRQKSRRLKPGESRAHQHHVKLFQRRPPFARRRAAARQSENLMTAASRVLARQLLERRGETRLPRKVCLAQ